MMSVATLELPADIAAQTSTRRGANPGASVSLTGLEKRYDGVGAVRGISLEVQSGEFLTLLGPSGSGKTTTLMMIAGFETPSAGDIAVDGRSVIAIPPNKRNLGMVFQNYALFPHLSVADNIGFPLKQRGVDRTARARMVAEALEVVRLPGYGGRSPRQLSGGQQQRVALARAIVFRPRLLLMDEPLGALDKQLREGLQMELRRLHAELGITFIYVTHDQDEALTMSDRIAVVNEGRIAQLGTPEDLYDRPSDRFVASFIGESNFLPCVLQGFRRQPSRRLAWRQPATRVDGGSCPGRNARDPDHAARAHSLRQRIRSGRREGEPAQRHRHRRGIRRRLLPLPMPGRRGREFHRKAALRCHCPSPPPRRHRGPRLVRGGHQPCLMRPSRRPFRMR